MNSTVRPDVAWQACLDRLRVHGINRHPKAVS